MNNTDLIKRVAILKANPQLAEVIPQSDIIKLLSEVVAAFSVLQEAIETNKIKGEKGDDGITPRPGVDYPSMAQVEASFTRALTAFEKEYAKLEAQIAQKLSTVTNGKDGKDAEITPADRNEIAAIAARLIQLPDFNAMMSLEADAFWAALELQRDEIDQLKQDIKTTGRQGGGTIGKIQVYNWIRQAVTDGTIPTGGSGSTYETPTGAVDGSNVTYTVSAIPKCIIYFGTTLFEGANGYSRSGLTITMPYAPTVSDQFKAVI